MTMAFIRSLNPCYDPVTGMGSSRSLLGVNYQLRVNEGYLEERDYSLGELLNHPIAPAYDKIWFLLSKDVLPLEEQVMLAFLVIRHAVSSMVGASGVQEAKSIFLAAEEMLTDPNNLNVPFLFRLSEQVHELVNELPFPSPDMVRYTHPRSVVSAAFRDENFRLWHLVEYWVGIYGDHIVSQGVSLNQHSDIVEVFAQESIICYIKYIVAESRSL